MLRSLKRVLGLLAMSVIWGCEFVDAAAPYDKSVTRLLELLCTWVYGSHRRSEMDLVFQDGFLTSVAVETSFCTAVYAIRRRDFVDSRRNGMLYYELGALYDYLHDDSGAFMRNGVRLTTFPQRVALLMCALVGRGCLDSPRPEHIPFLPHNDTQAQPDASINASSGAQGIPLPDLTEGLQRSFSPFTMDSWHLWYKARARSLIGDVENGIWQGGYTYGVEADAPVDPIMDRIQFRIVEQTEDRIVVNAANGIDNVGPFTIDGEFDLESCNFSARKEYATHHFIWRGAVTPLGIAGYYRMDNANGVGNPQGAFWLWKRDWKI